MTARAFVLLSGGIDSSVCLALACLQFKQKVVGVSVDYGQRHKKEMDYARMQCVDHGIDHVVLPISTIPRTMLTDPGAEIPKISYADIKGVSPTYVPFRNGLLLATLTSYVAGQFDLEDKKDNADLNAELQARGASSHVTVSNAEEWGIYFGAHAEDAQNWAYPDCCFEWTGAMAAAIYIGTYHRVRLHVPLQWMNKKCIVDLGHELGVDFSKTWSCYAGGEKHCGVCPTCQARRAGFVEAGISDPTEYEQAAA